MYQAVHSLSIRLALGLGITLKSNLEMRHTYCASWRLNAQKPRHHHVFQSCARFAGSHPQKQDRVLRSVSSALFSVPLAPPPTLSTINNTHPPPNSYPSNFLLLHSNTPCACLESHRRARASISARTAQRPDPRPPSTQKIPHHHNPTSLHLSRKQKKTLSDGESN